MSRRVDLGLPLGGPFHLDESEWHGQYRSVDGVEAGPITEDMVLQVIAVYEDDSEWDGEVAAVFRLKDGRFVGYETSYGPTGNGFHADAYGGDADVFFAPTLRRLVENALTMQAREQLGLQLLDDVPVENIPGIRKRLDLTRKRERKLT